MNYYARVQCPICGKEKQIPHIDGYGFFGVNKIHCDNCGDYYDVQENCKDIKVDENRNSEMENLRIENKKLKEENKKLREEIEKIRKGRGE